MINCMPDVPPVLLITRGLPGSGKTTYAKTWVSESAETRSRINRDDLRETMHGGAQGYVRELENAVTVAHHGSVRALLLAGRDVICDDMNLSNKQVKVWMQLAKDAGADFEIVDLTNVPVETCINRDGNRMIAGDRYVGGEYITKKHQQFIKGKPYPLPRPELSEQVGGDKYAAPLGKPKAILVDIDGTLAHMNGRGPFEWHRVGEDLPNRPVVDLVIWLQSYFGSAEEWVYQGPYPSPKIIFMSGRDEVCRAETEEWLSLRGFYAPKLYMRPSLPGGVNQPKDSIVKLALFNEHIRDQYDVQFVLDDRDQVVEMWRSIGLTCLQVAPGNF